MPFHKCFSCLQSQTKDEDVIKLDLSNKSLTDSFPDVWQHERTLEELYLTTTRIYSLPPQLFYCQNLRVLVVSNNNLESLPDAIGSLQHLNYLDLSRNFISTVPDNLKSCKNLSVLDLSCNNLQRVPDIITCLISVQELLLNETFLEFLPANFGRLVNLKILELRLNNLVTLPKSMVRLSNLQRLDIGGNEFKELPAVIGELKQLRELWIDFNQIRQIPSSVGKLRELKHFEANGNIIDFLSTEVGNWRSCEVFSICTNSLTSLAATIGMMKVLVTLKCEANYLSELPESICQLDTLEEVVLSHNKLLRLPSTIGRLRKLRFLFLDNNGLSSLPDEICSCVNLSILSVSCNKLTALPLNIGHLSKLKVLNIVNNHISSLPVSMLSLINLTSLWISDNQSQPLVPLQYLDAHAKMHLTCFMLPQSNSKENRYIENGMESREYNQYSTNYSKPNLPTISLSPSKHICFSEETTIVSTVPSQNINRQTEEVPMLNEITARTSSPEKEHCGVRLMRSPTPYPKELRLMKKYVKNYAADIASKQNYHNTGCDTDSVLIDSPYHPSDLNKNNTNLENNDENIYVASQYYTKAQKEEDYHHHQMQLQTGLEYIPVTAQLIEVTLPTAENCDFYEVQNDFRDYADDNVQNFSKPYMLYEQAVGKTPSAHNCNDYEPRNNINNNINCNVQDTIHPEQSIPYYVSQEYETNAANLRDIPDFGTQEYSRNLEQRFAQANQSGVNVENANSWNQDDNSLQYMNGISIDHTPLSIIDNENNIRHGNTSLLNQKYVVDNVEACTDWNTGSLTRTTKTLPFIEEDRRVFEKSNNTHVNYSTNSSTRKSPWLFGAHKNPTVKQISLKCENSAGFYVAAKENQEGIIVSSLEPNSNASRVLCVNDKILELDGHDFTNISLQQAKMIIGTAGPVINLMLSRK